MTLTIMATREDGRQQKFELYMDPSAVQQRIPESLCRIYFAPLAAQLIHFAKENA